LKVCRLSTESPLSCVSGVTGADVKRRLRAIITGSIAQELTNTRRAALAIFGLAAVLVPIAIGVLTAPVGRAQIAPSNTPAFEVAALKVNRSAPDFSSKGRLSNGRLVFTNFSLRYLIAEAWSLRATDIVGPSWLEDVSIDLAAKVPSPVASDAEVRQMIQTLLKERMRLVAHLEDRVVPVFGLTVWKGKPKLNRSELPAKPEDTDCSMHNETAKVLLDCHYMSMAEFAHELPGPGSRYLDKRIVDQTNLSGLWDFKLEWTKMTELESYGGLTLFAALESQLGLHLEEKKAAAPVLVIDSVEKTPRDN
jgi:bla regulator protein blaR1